LGHVKGASVGDRVGGSISAVVVVFSGSVNSKMVGRKVGLQLRAELRFWLGAHLGVCLGVRRGFGMLLGWELSWSSVRSYSDNGKAASNYQT
jgi:hypothetical protein